MENILREIAANEGFSSKANVEMFGSGIKDGTNFHGSLVKGAIIEDGRTLSVVIKNEVVCEEILSKQKSSNEVHFYTEIYPKLQEFGDAPKIPRYLWSGKLGEGTTIVMEDLSAKGYKMVPLDTILDDNHAQIALKELDKLHVTSKKMKAQNPALFDKLVAKLEEGLCACDMFDKILELCFENAKRATKKHLTKDYQERLDRFDCARAKDWAKKDRFPEAGLTHGDSWAGNILFKYEGDRPTEVAIIDWQMCRVGSPFLDISQLLFASCGGYGVPEAPECSFGLMMAMLILPFSLGQADAKLILTPEKIQFLEDHVVMERLADIVRVACDSGII